MDDHSDIDTNQIQKPKRKSTNRLFILVLFIGMLMGVVITVAVGYGLYIFDYIDLIWWPIPEATEVVTSPTHTIPSPACPTCPPVTPEILVVTATPEPTITPDIGATATAACEEFNAQFPGTPCPSPVVP